MKMTPTAVLAQRAGSTPAKTAFVFREDVWTYQRLAKAAGRLSRGIAALGVRPGDRVALHMTNRPEMIVAYYACFQLGAVAAPLRTAFKSAELDSILQRLKPALYIGETALYPNVAPIAPSTLPPGRRFIIGDGVVDDDGVRRWDHLFDDRSDHSALFKRDVDAPAVLINTSGTTGAPKFVIHTPSTLAATSELAGKYRGFEPGDIAIGQTPLAHMSGLATTITNIQAGIPIMLLEAFDAETVLETIERYSATYLVGFPAQYALLLQEQRANPRKVDSLRLCVTGGDVCPEDLQAQFLTVFGTPLRNGWAATEAVGSLASARQSGPVTRIIPEVQIRLIAEQGEEVPRGEIGELLVRGPNVFVGYWDDPELTARVLTDGWYHTGDLMRRGEADDLWFAGRKNDLIIRGGTNISPVEVEQVLAAHPAVRAAAVAGVPDSVLGQRVIGFVKLVDGAKDSIISELLADAAVRLADYKVPEKLFAIDKLPRNPQGKLDRKALTAMSIKFDHV
jgi:long-chain acyl-CoA synthetase